MYQHSLMDTSAFDDTLLFTQQIHLSSYFPGDVISFGYNPLTIATEELPVVKERTK